MERSKMELLLLTGFVDDVRQGGTSLRIGLRYNIEKKEWNWSKDAFNEDLILREEGENRDQRMVRICLPVCNSINRDLEFTAETASDFKDMRLPTLDFSLWLENGKVNHSYFQKPMKTQFVLMRESAMSQQQKIQILANDIVRRLSNVNVGEVPKEDISMIMEIAIRELKTSGHKRKEVSEIVCSGMTGWMRKLKRRREEGEMYRPAYKTLAGRCKKKLLENTNWYKVRRKRDRDEFEEIEKGEDSEGEKGGDWKRRKKNGDKGVEKKVRKIEPKAKAVFFIPYTHNSLLAKQLRESEAKLYELTGYKLKIVERAGVKLEDLLRKSDPWQGMDCLRIKCLHCKTKEHYKPARTQSCSKRNLVYEIWCLECEKKCY